MEIDSKYKPELDITLEKMQENIETLKEMAANKLLQVSNLKADQEGLFVGVQMVWSCFPNCLMIHDGNHSGETKVTNAYQGTSLNAAKKIVENYKDILWMMEIKLETV